MNKKKIDLLTKIERIEERKQAQDEISQKPDHHKPPSKDEITMVRVCNIDKKCVDLEVSVKKPGWCIRSVLLFSDGMFPKGGSHAVHPITSTNKLVVPLRKEKNNTEQINITVLLGAGLNAPFFLTHREPTYLMPKFAFIRPLKTLQEKNKFTMSVGVVRFQLTDCSVDDILSWADSAFSLGDYLTSSGDANPAYFTRTQSQLSIRLVDVRTHDSIIFTVDSAPAVLKV